MFCRKFVVLGVTMLLAGICAADPTGHLNTDPVSINVSAVGGTYQGMEQVYFTATTDCKYLVELFNYSEEAIDVTLTGDWAGDGDDWQAFTFTSPQTSDDVLAGVKVESEVTTASFCFYLYWDEDGDGKYTVGEEVLDTAVVNTF